MTFHKEREAEFEESLAKGDEPVVCSGFGPYGFLSHFSYLGIWTSVALIRFFCLFQVPGEAKGEAEPAGKKTIETVKAVSYLALMVFYEE